MRVLGGLLAAFVGGIVGFFALFGALALVLLCWAAGCVSSLYLVAALWQTARWWLAHDAVAGQAALGCWAIAAVAFAVTPVLVRGAGMLREKAASGTTRRREHAALERIGRLRLAAR